MANARSIDVDCISVDDGKTEPKSISVDRINAIKVRVYHSKGGMNYFTYEREPAGYYFGLTPIYREISENGLTCESCLLGSGYKVHVEAGERFNAKKLKELAATVMQRKDFLNILETLCQKNNLTVLNALVA